MKVVVVGATGTIGKAVVAALAERHEVVQVGNSRGDVRVDITSTESIEAMYQQIGAFDALVSATGAVHFGELVAMDQAAWDIGINSKLMGQVNLVMAGLNKINDGGSFTLTTGILAEDPIRFGASASMVNGGLESFVKAAALEMPRGLRINAVSPTLLEESLEAYGPYFRGFDTVTAAQAALGFCKSVEGARTGTVIKVVGQVH